LSSANVALLNWPSVSLRGVLRSELQGAMEKYVGTYLREPRLRVFPLTRVSIIGGVVRPGVYPVDPTRSLSDAIMTAGGTGTSGKADKITVYRGERRIMSEDRVAEAIQVGSTLEELGLLSGDQIRVALQRTSGGARLQPQTILLAVSVVTALIAFIRASYVP
jgi:protein involved in polysaccharide export with SLBB domain